MSKLSIENIVRDKAAEFEITVPENAWNDFETKIKASGNELTPSKNVSGSIISTTATKIVLIASLFVIPVIGIYFLMDIGKAEREKIFKKHKNEAEQIINEVEPAEEATQNVNKKEKELIENTKTDEDNIFVFKPINEGNIVYFGPAEANRENITKFRLLIRDKKGKLIFESNNQKVLWDGKIKGKDRYAKDGLYDWFIVIEDSTNEVYRRKGKVKLEKQ